MNIIGYIKSLINEIKLTSWPTLSYTLNMALVIVFVSLILGIYIGGLDFFLTEGRKWLLSSIGSLN